METSTLSNDAEGANSTQQTQSDFIEQQIGDYLFIYGSPIIIILGTVGNVLAVLVFSLRHIGSKPTSLLIRILAIFDTLVLYTGLLRYWIKATWLIDIRGFSVEACRTHTYLLYVFITVSVWTLVTVTLHRVVVVVKPLKAKAWLTMKNTYIMFVVLLIISMVLNLHILWTVSLIKGECMNEATVWWTRIWPKLDLCINALIPFFVLMLSNVCIICKVHQSANAAISKSSTGGPTKSRINSMTAMLLSVNLVFLLTNMPITIYNLEIIFKPESAHDYAVDWLVWASMNILLYINNAANFYIYSISGPYFRSEVWAFVRCRKGQPKTMFSASEKISSFKRTINNGKHISYRSNSHLDLVKTNSTNSNPTTNINSETEVVKGFDNKIVVCDTHM